MGNFNVVLGTVGL